MHARRERRIDRIFRLRCKVCGGVSVPELGGDDLEAARAGGPVEMHCYGRCNATAEHEVVAP